MAQVARNTANILPDGTNVGRGVVQVDEAWEFGQVLSVVMIFANVNEIIHFLLGLYSRWRHGETEETAQGGAELELRQRSTTAVRAAPGGISYSRTWGRTYTTTRISGGDVWN